MSLNDLTLGELISGLSGMVSEGQEGGRAVMLSHTKLSGWVSDIDGSVGELTTAAAQAAVLPPAFPVGEGVRRDRRAESAVHLLTGALGLARHKATAEGRDAEAARWAAIHDFIFDAGMGFLGASYLTQAGQTERAIQRVQDPEVAEEVATLVVLGVTFADILALITQNNTSLKDYATAISDPGPSEPTLTIHQARRNALAVLRDLLPIIDRALPESDPVKALSRARVLSAFNKAMADSHLRQLRAERRQGSSP